MADDHGPADPWTFAAALTQLKATLHPRQRGPYTVAEIAAGAGLSQPYVVKLLRGERGSPRYEAVQAFARFFGVPPDYFVDAALAARVNEEIATVIEWRDGDRDLGGRQLAQRVMDLSPQDRQAVTEMVQQLQDYQDQPRDRRRRRKPG